MRNYKFARSTAASVLADVVKDNLMMALVVDHIPRPGEGILRLSPKEREILKTLKAEDIQNIRIDHAPAADYVHRRRGYRGERYWQTTEEEFQRLLNKCHTS